MIVGYSMLKYATEQPVGYAVVSSMHCTKQHSVCRRVCNTAASRHSSVLCLLALSLTCTMNNFKQSVPFIACNTFLMMIKGRIGIFIAGMGEL